MANGHSQVSNDSCHILSSIITDMDKTWLYYLSLLFFIVLILVLGLWLIRDKKEGV